ncbi:MAG: sulfur carrier protein ThiS [Campylobacterota bacterium]|nr:sulfur carrier protein ThiS [Campylobacterota bacterium]
MTIIVNGKEIQTDEGVTMQALLLELSLEGKVMAAAVNMDIVKQDAWNLHVIKEGDKIELLDFVGGG